jgi:hypothetical protein
MNELQGRGGLFSEGRNTNSSKLVERPHDCDKGPGTGREGRRCNGDNLLELVRLWRAVL